MRSVLRPGETNGAQADAVQSSLTVDTICIYILKNI